MVVGFFNLAKPTYLWKDEVGSDFWRFAFDVQEPEDGCNYTQCRIETVKGKPTIEQIKQIITAEYNRLVSEKIVSELEYEGSLVWLSAENQANYKAAYDMAVQTNGESLPYRIKLGSDDEPIYKTFVTLSDIRDFWQTCLAHIQSAIEWGWDKKDSVDYSVYDTTE